MHVWAMALLLRSMVENFLEKLSNGASSLKKHDIENFLEVRIGFEGVAASNAATCATSADIDSLEELLSKTEAVVQGRRHFAVLDLDFHVTLAKASGNTLLFDLVSMIRN